MVMSMTMATGELLASVTRKRSMKDLKMAMLLEMMAYLADCACLSFSKGWQSLHYPSQQSLVLKDSSDFPP